MNDISKEDKKKAIKEAKKELLKKQNNTKIVRK